MENVEFFCPYCDTVLIEKKEKLPYCIVVRYYCQICKTEIKPKDYINSYKDPNLF